MQALEIKKTHTVRYTANDLNVGQAVTVCLPNGQRFEGAVMRVSGRYAKIDLGSRVYTYNYATSPGWLEL